MSANVLIVGAGTTGLILALSLLRNGVPVRIIEKQSHFPIGQRGAGIYPRTLEIHKFLGTLPDILKESTPAPTITKHCTAPDDGRPAKIVPFMEHLESTPSRPIHNGVLLGQNHHERILRTHLLKDYGCVVELATELRSFEQHPDHVVAKVVKTTDSGEIEETVDVNWLVGADGARSTVRKQLGIDFVGETPSGAPFIVGDAIVEGDALTQDRDGWCIWGNPSQQNSLFLRPCFVPGKSLYAFMLRVPEADVQRIFSSHAQVIKVLDETIGRKDIKFREIEVMAIWRPNIRMIDSFGKGRVFVAGDAAHVHSPTGGQGMNSGALDSFNLGWKLAFVQKGLAPASILESYTAERLPVIAAMLNKTTELFQQTFVTQTADSSAAWVRGYELRMFGVNYRGSPIILDEKYSNKDDIDPYRSGEDGTVRAGDRAPDAPALVRVGASTEDSITLFDIFKPNQFTALVFPGWEGEAATAKLLAPLEKYPVAIVNRIVVLPDSISDASLSGKQLNVIDASGYAYKHYAIDKSQPTVVIVRPDGSIGAQVTSGERGLISYFERIFV